MPVEQPVEAQSEASPEGSMHELAVYLVQSPMGDLPSEQYYTTMVCPGATLIGHIRSRYPIQATGEGAMYWHPDAGAAGRISARSLVLCAVNGYCDLSWKSVVAPRPHTKDPHPCP